MVQGLEWWVKAQTPMEYPGGQFFSIDQLNYDHDQGKRGELPLQRLPKEVMTLNTCPWHCSKQLACVALHSP